jgi:hypothetical protein
LITYGFGPGYASKKIFFFYTYSLPFFCLSELDLDRALGGIDDMAAPLFSFTVGMAPLLFPPFCLCVFAPKTCFPFLLLTELVRDRPVI